MHLLSAYESKKEANRKKGYVKSSTLVILAFATAFLARCLESLGAPSPVNFLHFLAVPFACGVVLSTSKSKNQNQISISWLIIGGLFILLGVIFASALLNEAGVINAVLSFLLLGEPFMILLAIISLPLSPESFDKFRTWLVRLLFFHIFLVFFQKFILRVENWHHLGMEPVDRIQGVFFLSGAGHVVGASVSLTFGLYYFLSAKAAPLWFRIAVVFAAFGNILFADAKQVLLVFMVSGVLLIVTKFDNIIQAIKYITGATVFGYGFLWCIANLEAFKAYNTWSDPELYGPQGNATLLKMSTFRIVPSHYESFLNWFFGLGPGHTVGRLGGWMLHRYSDLLSPLGATVHQASFEVWREVASFYIGDRSSMFSPLFGWAGIWGDLGFLGLAAYLSLGFIVWRYVCPNDLSKFLILNVFIFGLVFSQMEEPGYMLSVATIIGLQWQEHQRRKYDSVAIDNRPD